MSDYQCPSCGGFCKKSGCERENVLPQSGWAEYNALVDRILKGTSYSHIDDWLASRDALPGEVEAVAHADKGILNWYDGCYTKERIDLYSAEALCWIIDCADIGDAEKIARTALGEAK